MTVAYSYIPVVEEILIGRLTKYLYEDCKWANQFPNFPQVRINNEYPWVPYMQDEAYFTNGWLDLNKVQEGLFPAITIVTTQDTKSPQIMFDYTATTLLKEELNDFKAQAAEDGYLISPEALQAIEDHFSVNDFLYGMNFIYQKRDSIAIDITTDDETSIKNRIYDLVYLFLSGHGNMSLKTDLDIAIIDGSLNGNRSGTYNVDFGRVLRGATIGFEVDYKISQVFYETSVGLINSISIDHTVETQGGS